MPSTLGFCCSVADMLTAVADALPKTRKGLRGDLEMEEEEGRVDGQSSE